MLRAVEAALASPDPSSIEVAVRDAAAAILTGPDLGALLVEAEQKHGRRNAIGVLSHKLAHGDPLRQQTVARSLRRLRHRIADTCPSVAPDNE